jgi:uncharacterized membrane protein HdeD (DUF308 family)
MTSPDELPTSPLSPFSPALRAELKHELEHLREHWWWLLALGLVLVVAGSACIVVPSLTVTTTFVTILLLGISLMVTGVAIIVSAFWAGKWSGFLLQLLVGLLYLVGGLSITEAPGQSVVMATLLLSSLFIVLGSFRVVAALVYRFPQWGWVLLNGAITSLVGVIIFKHLPKDALWVIGLLVGIEMLFNGWTWVMLSLAIRNFPQPSTVDKPAA